jgi:hypothetical protein
VWLINSNATRPDVVQQFCKDHGAYMGAVNATLTPHS